MDGFFSFLAAFAVVAVLIPLMRKVAIRAGFVDRPGGRKQHEGPAALIGGLVIFPAAAAVMLLDGFSPAQYWPLFSGLAVLLVMGAVDDRIHLHAMVKFFIQLGVASLIVLSDHARIYSLGDLFGFGDLELGFMSIPFSIAAVALLINAVNLMDGLDGLAGGVSFIVLSWLVAAGALLGRAEVFYALAPLMGALAGFLIYNMRSPWRKRARVFLGDAGSLGLGLVLAWFCIGFAKGEAAVLEPISMAWLLALPVWDECAQFYRRVREGRHPFSPDRGHFHHHLVHAGYTPARAAALILLICFVLGGVGVVGVHAGVPLAVLTWGWIMCILAHIWVSQKPERYIAFFKK